MDDESKPIYLTGSVAFLVERDLAQKRVAELESEVRRLKAAVQEHYDQCGDDRCHLDDDKLYHEVLGVGSDPYATALPPECDMIESCLRYIRQRQYPEAKGKHPMPEYMTISQLTKEVERLKHYYEGLKVAAGDLVALVETFHDYVPPNDIYIAGEVVKVWIDDRNPLEETS